MKRGSLWFVAGALFVLIVGAATWAGAHGGDTTKIHGCVVPQSGYLRIVGASATCKKGETAVDWSIQGVAPTLMDSSSGFSAVTTGPCGTVVAGTLPITLTRPSTIYTSARGNFRRQDGTTSAKANLRVFLVDGQDQEVAQLAGHPEDSVVDSNPNDTIELTAIGVLRGGGQTLVAPPGTYTLRLDLDISGLCPAGGGSGTHELAFSVLNYIATPVS